jgi:hypothetical protein
MQMPSLIMLLPRMHQVPLAIWSRHESPLRRTKTTGLPATTCSHQESLIAVPCEEDTLFMIYLFKTIAVTNSRQLRNLNPALVKIPSLLALLTWP